MIKKNLKVLIVTSLVILLPILAGIILWNQLPEQIPSHWNASGEVDGWSSKPFAVFGMPLILLAFQWLCVIATGADPKKQNHGSKILSLVFWIIPVMNVLLSTLTYCAAMGKQVRVEVRSTFSPEDGGTALCRESTAERGVRGIACDDNVAMVTVMGLGSGAGTCRLFGLLAESGIAIDVIIRSPGSGSGRVRFSVSADDSDRVTALLRSCQQELGFSGFLIHPGMAKVSVVGDGLGGGCGVAAKMLQALQAGGIEPAYITTGDKRTSVIVGKDQACPAVRLLHTAFFGE